MNVDFYNIPKNEKHLIFTEVSERVGMPVFAVEKDWWVSQTLSVIFNTKLSKHLVFKGGTSLSKGWKLIDRFSEDIDLAVDRCFFGYSGDLSKKMRTKLRKDAHKYISNSFYNELKKYFSDTGIQTIEIKQEITAESDKDPNIIEVHYPSIIDSPRYISSKVQIEIGCRSLIEPTRLTPIASLVDEMLPNSTFSSSPVIIPIVCPEPIVS